MGVMSKQEEITYTAAFEELKEIVDQLENDNISVDELTEKMKRATVLMKICRDKLTKTEEEVNKTIAELS
jgi:exodeoxyribonuclease VII small subunit